MATVGIVMFLMLNIDKDVLRKVLYIRWQKF